MFVLDKTLLGLVAAEMDVSEVYRSLLPQNVAVEGLPQLPCEAFACAISPEGGASTDVYVMLRFPGEKYSLVYRPDRPVTTPSEHAAAMDEARNFLAAMGFELEQVNLNYSRAMREVVIRGLRLLSAPGSLDGMRHPLYGKSVTAASVRVPSPPSAPSAPKPTSPAGGSTAAAAGPSVADEVVRLQDEIDGMKRSHGTALAAAVSSRDAAAAEVDALRQQLEAAACEVQVARRAQEEALASLGREREQAAGASVAAYARLEHELGEVEGEKERLSAELAAMEKAYAQELDELRKELKRHAVEKETLRQTLTAECDGLLEKVNTFAAEKHAVETTLGGQLEAVRHEATQLAAELDALRERQARELSGLTAEWEQLMMEKSADHDRLARELANARAETEQLRSAPEAAAELSALRQELARVDAEKATAEKSLRQMLAVVEEEEHRRTEEHAAREAADAAERDRFESSLAQLTAERQELRTALEAARGEKAAAERDLHQTISSLEGEIELLAAEKDALAEAHAVEMAGLRSRLKRVPGNVDAVDAPGGPAVVAVHAVPSPGAVAAPPSAPAPAASLPEADPQPEPIAASPAVRPKRKAAPAGNDEDELAADVGPADGMFHMSGRLKGIEINEGDELIELHRSINMLNVAADGYPMQKSSSYVCAVRKGGVVRVFIALYLTESKAAQVYVTAVGKKTPPWEDAVSEAMLFTETLGFMMDRVDLGRDPDEHDTLLAGIPVFQF